MPLVHTADASRGEWIRDGLGAWATISRGHRDPGLAEDGWHYGAPEQGKLPVEQLAAVAGILAGHTAAPEDCIAGLWEGWGWISMSRPRLELPGRGYLLFGCAVREFEDPDWGARSGWDSLYGRFWGQTPNQLWPEDRSWFLASEVDFDSTLIGGSLALVAELLAHPALEAAEIPENSSLTHDADRIN